MKPVVFLGPTLPKDEALMFLDATYLPPVAQGDVISAVESLRPSSVGIVDGVFYQDLSVWHKEILYALSQGIPVWGAASMGALRAAELHRFGMRGCGWIFEQFQSGLLANDDEVVLMHAPEDLSYKKLSEPLVNIRATLTSASQAGRISAELERLVIRTAQSLYFADRTVPNLMSLLRSQAMLTPREQATVKSVLTSGYVDVKRLDAVLMLREMAADVGTKQTEFAFQSNALFKHLYANDRRVNTPAGTIDFAGICRYASLHDLAFETSRFNALNRELVQLLADIIGVEPTAAEIETEARLFRMEVRLNHEEQFAQWLQDNHLNLAEFNILMTNLATCRRMHRWLLGQSKRSELKTRAVLDQLRLESRYEAAALNAAKQNSIVGSPYSIDYSGSLQELFELHHKKVAVRPSATLSTWSEEVGYLNIEDLRYELARANKSDKHDEAREISVPITGSGEHDRSQEG